MVRLFLFLTATAMLIAVIPVIAQADNFQTWLTDLRVEAQNAVCRILFLMRHLVMLSQ